MWLNAHDKNYKKNRHFLSTVAFMLSDDKYTSWVISLQWRMLNLKKQQKKEKNERKPIPFIINGTISWHLFLFVSNFLTTNVLLNVCKEHDGWNKLIIFFCAKISELKKKLAGRRNELLLNEVKKKNISLKSWTLDSMIS